MSKILRISGGNVLLQVGDFFMSDYIFVVSFNYSLEICIMQSALVAVTLMLMKKLGTNDYNFADFLKGLLQYDPGNGRSVYM